AAQISYCGLRFSSDEFSDDEYRQARSRRHYRHREVHVESPTKVSVQPSGFRCRIFNEFPNPQGGDERQGNAVEPMPIHPHALSYTVSLVVSDSSFVGRCTRLTAPAVSNKLAEERGQAMLSRVRLFGVLMMLSFMSTVVAGINWKAVWLDAPYNPVHLKVGESLPYIVTGLNGMDTRAD